MTKSVATRPQGNVILAGEPDNAPSFSFQDMQRMSVSIAKSGLFGVKDADQALALMMISQAEGKHPALVARDYHIINGRPAKSADAMLRDFQSSGGRVEWHSLTDELASATFTHPLSTNPVKIDWDMPRAKKAGLAGKAGGMYEKFPRAMLRSRVVSEGVRSVAPGATSGFYTIEEVRQMEEEQPPQETITQAIEHTAAALPQDEIDILITSMDVKTYPELEAAFANCWRATRDPALRLRFKGIYESMKAEIAEQAAKAADEVPQ